jgi:hypothetical protein
MVVPRPRRRECKNKTRGVLVEKRENSIKLGGCQGYAGNDDVLYSSHNQIETSKKTKMEPFWLHSAPYHTAACAAPLVLSVTVRRWTAIVWDWVTSPSYHFLPQPRTSWQQQGLMASENDVGDDNHGDVIIGPFRDKLDNLVRSLGDDRRSRDASVYRVGVQCVDRERSWQVGAGRAWGSEGGTRDGA